jgi:membrane associated rhomboid family serine protease
MYDDIRGDLRIKPLVAWITLGACLLASIAVLLDERFENIFGVYHSQGVNFFTRATAPIVHGYSPITTVLHLFSTIVLMYFFGTFLEKVIGSFRFLLLTLISMGVYVLIHRAMLFIGHGFTPILMTYSGVLLIAQLEARFVKTNTVFDDYYRLMWTILGLSWVILPIIFSVAPVYFDSKAKMGQMLLYGNLLNIVGFLIGLVLALIFRKDIRDRLVHYTRKKYAYRTRADEWAWLGALIIPLYLVFIFLWRP